MTNLVRAKALFQTGDYTCVLCKDDVVFTSTKIGIAPMIDFIEGGTDLRGFSAADKIVGKAAAMLFVLAEVKEVFASVMSRQAEEVFLKHGVSCSFETLTDNIVNRSGTGLCPMEEAVKDIADPREAFEAIKRTLENLKNRNTEDKR